MLSIGEFARASGLTAKALRLYDELDLLRPAAVDASNGYRYYDPEQVGQARLVARLRSAGMPLPRIAAVIGAPTPEAAAGEVLSYWRRVEADRASARGVIASLVAFLTGQDTTMASSATPDSTLADLIASLYEECPYADDLARVGAAGRRARALSELGDQLIDHFVSEARLGGASWSQISDTLGRVGRTTDGRAGDGREGDGAARDGAAGPRSGASAFDRFTDPSRHSIVVAQEAARTHRHELIDTGHLLLGLLSEPESMAYEILVTRGDSEQQLREAVEEAMVPAGEEALSGHIPFGPDSKEAIELAVRVSSDWDHDWVGTEHLLLGLIGSEDSLGAQVLRSLGFTAEELRDAVGARVATAMAPGTGRPTGTGR